MPTQPPVRPLSLIKMHSAGNDYVYLDTINGPPLPEDVDIHRLAVELADRHFGVGGDGLIIIERRPSGRLGMRMFNSDGSEGEMCGNGMRCLAAYAWKQGFVSGPRFEVETLAGIIVPEIAPGQDRSLPDLMVTVDMGPPREIRPLELTLGEVTGWTSAAGGVPGAGEAPPEQQVPQTMPPTVRPTARATLQPTRANIDGCYRGVFVSMGNPHFVTFVPDVRLVDLAAVGPALEHHPAFPSRANIEFVQVLASDRLRMRIWERGSGITLASGTGSSASLVAAATVGAAGRSATVFVDGGELGVEWCAGGTVKVAGLAVEVFRTIWSRPLARSRR